MFYRKKTLRDSLIASATALILGFSANLEKASADPIEVYEDFPRQVVFISAPWLDSPSLLRLSFLRGKKIEPGSYRLYLSKEVTLKALNEEWTGDERAVALFMNICSERPNGPWHYREVREVDMTWDGAGFLTHPLVIVFDRTDRLASYKCYQEIALVVDGIWHTDPVSLSHNFRYDMANPIDP